MSNKLGAHHSASWVAVAYDIISKYRELGTMGDAEASQFVSEWDTATENKNVSKLLEMEASLITNAVDKTQILGRMGGMQLLRLREDRHLCAHPAFSSEADLFEPSPELVRMHLVCCIEHVLSQAPLQGTAILEQFGADILSPGYPSSDAQIANYVEQRYLARTKSRNVLNFGMVLAKSILKDVPADWSLVRNKVVVSLRSVKDRAPLAWEDISVGIVQLIDRVQPDERLSAISFLAEFPEFYELVAEHTRTALKQTIVNLNAADVEGYGALAAFNIPDLQESIGSFVAGLQGNQITAAVTAFPLDVLWPKALAEYAASGSFRWSESTFQQLIMPYTGRLTSEKLDQLVVAIYENGQNWDAAQTPELFLRLLQNTQPEDFPSHEARDELYTRLVYRHHRRDPYSDVFQHLTTDGWTFPARKEEEED